MLDAHLTATSKHPAASALRSALSGVALLVAGVTAHAQSYSYTLIDVPGAGATQPSGINDEGAIVGWYGACPPPFSCPQLGFIRKGSQVETIDVPGTVDTRVFGINRHGDVAGVTVFYEASSGNYVEVGFVRLADGTYGTLLVPGTGLTRLHSINAAGDLAGSYQIVDGDHSFILRGWSISAGQITGGTYESGGFPSGYNNNGTPHAIDNAGTVVGQYSPFGGGVSGYLRSGGNYHLYNSPSVPAVYGVQTELRGINGAGALVGNIPYHGFVLSGYSVGAGIVSGGVEVQIDLPGGGSTLLRGINSAGQVVGINANGGPGNPAYLATPSLGDGTAGTGGITPVHFTKGGVAQLGNSAFRFASEHLLGGTVAFLYVGLQTTALPLLGGLVYVAPPQVLFVGKLTGGQAGIGGTGSIEVATPIPADPTLSGLALYSQVFALDAASPGQIAMSQGLATTLSP
jgi:hypothetical protein